ncbi:hypothetical protein [Azospirillum endophyticum]
MNAFSFWINPILAGIMAFVGLLASSRAADEGFAAGGLVVFIACVIFIFVSIGRYFDRMGSAH